MAGELDLRPVSPAFALETSVDVPTGNTKGEVPLRDEQKDPETQDASEERRQTLAKVLSEREHIPSGKLIIERDQDTGKYVQKVIDPKSGKVLRQWPEEEFLELAKQMGEAYGLLIDKLI
jgi:flagellar protein FlaG